ncbi:helix-turn-helix transcriptional regulator [Streptomyces sp. NPDC057052]|uniref:helix-turn-helix domain-containing protein n=1 Tax=Streptomyces sp. NPDC057052 TaxID=3346010 RepID=UPI0036366229
MAQAQVEGEDAAESGGVVGDHGCSGLVRAYGLSPRECAVAELVFHGCSTQEIGRRLRLSPHTVQDHLKAVFDKTGVRSRRDLVAAIFSRHYAPTATPRPDATATCRT